MINTECWPGPPIEPDAVELQSVARQRFGYEVALRFGRNA